MRSPSHRENNWGKAGSIFVLFFCLLGYVGGHFGVILEPSRAILEARKPKWLAKGVLERPWGALGASWNGLVLVCCRSLIFIDFCRGFGTDLGSFGDDFVSDLGAYWDHVRIMLEYF